jgi:proline-specific peptidase
MYEQEGFIPVSGYRVWYRIVGGGADLENIPLLALHGGPGVPHDYIENLADLASDTRRVILYDQLGCGRSDQPDDTSLWRVERFVEELGIVRRELGLDQVHLLGQSWGGMLAIEYALTQPRGLVSLILASTLSSMPMWVAGSEWVIFENSSHMAHIEEPELYLPAVQSFIERIEAQRK